MSSTNEPSQGAGQSLQNRLVALVLGLVCLVWGLAAFLTWNDTRHEVDELLDAHLSQAAALLVSQPLDDLSRIDLRETPALHEYQSRVVIQVWHGQSMMVRSATAPLEPLAPQGLLGFSQVLIGDVVWRVFSTPGRDEHVVIQVAEQVRARDDVVMASLRSVIWPMALALPLLALGVWAAVRHAVKPLRELGWRVAHRRPDGAEPLPLAGVPREARPLVHELNRLFGRMAALIESERRFTADAAHELRTPIAATRMQAQVAQGATSDAERAEALAATVQGCDRATHLVEQLLQLARLESQTDGVASPSALLPCVSAVLSELAGTAAARNQQLEWAPPDGHAWWSPAPEALTHILLRNLLDNALRYSPDGACVCVQVQRVADGRVMLTVEDSGPGMTPDHMNRLGERFFRVVGSGQSGSGLGWSIVTRIAQMNGIAWQLARSTRLGGLRVDVTWAESSGTEKEQQ